MVSTLPQNIKSFVDKKQDAHLTLREIDDDCLKALADYMAAQQSVVVSITLTECDISRDGIQYLLTTYGQRLEALNMPNNYLGDEDIKDLVFPENVQSLGVRDNALSTDVIQQLKKRFPDRLDLGTTPSLPDENSRSPLRFTPSQKPLVDQTTHKCVDDFVSDFSKLNDTDQHLAMQVLAEKLHVFNIKLSCNWPVDTVGFLKK